MQAYIDHHLFGALPRAGGTFDQPDELLREMRIVANIVNKARARRRKADDDALERRLRSGGIR